MADAMISVEKIKAFYHSQIHDPDKWDLNKNPYDMVDTASFCASCLPAGPQPSSFVQKLLRALGLFAGSIILMRQYGDLMAV